MKIYKGVIILDVIVENSFSGNCIEAAVKWLKEKD